MKDYASQGNAAGAAWRRAGLSGGRLLGTVHEQRFYAIRANGPELRFPFAAQPFTALVDMATPVDDALLRNYASALVAHGCVQAICRGEESHRLAEVFDELAERGDCDRDGPPFTSMATDDEPLPEVIEYFVLPSGLASAGLLVVIGDAGDFQRAIDGFSTAAGAIRGDLASAVRAEDDLVCFVSS